MIPQHIGQRSSRFGHHQLAARAFRQRSARGTKSGTRNRAALHVSAIGFDFGDRDKADAYSGFASARQPKRQSPLKSAGYLASQLLVYHSVVRSPIGESFLALVASLFKASTTNKDIVEAYSSLYYKLAVSGYDTWEDYVLDQIFFARDNTFARAVAEGLLKGDAPLRAAAAHDLDILQQLAVPQQQLLQYLSSVVPSTSDSYVEAGESTSSKSHEHRTLLPSGSAIDISGTYQYLQGPLSAEQLAHWRAAVASKERWSEALPLVQQYYLRHGYGLTSRNSTLRWKGGALEEAGEGQQWRCDVKVYEEQRARVRANTIRHLEGEGAQHVLLCGAGGSGKSRLLWEEQLKIGKERGLRLVDVPAGEVGALVEAARGCGRYPRVRFILTVDHMDLPLRGAAASDLMSALERGGGMAWPTNVLLYMAASPTCALSFSDPLISRFGMVEVFSELQSEQFAAAVQQLAGGCQLPEGTDVLAGAESWAAGRGGLSLRAARQWVLHLGGVL